MPDVPDHLSMFMLAGASNNSWKIDQREVGIGRTSQSNLNDALGNSRIRLFVLQNARLEFVYGRSDFWGCAHALRYLRVRCFLFVPNDLQLAPKRIACVHAKPGWASRGDIVARRKHDR